MGGTAERTIPCTYHREKTPQCVLVSGDLIVTSVQGGPSCNKYAICLIGTFFAAPVSHVGSVLLSPKAVRVGKVSRGAGTGDGKLQTWNLGPYLFPRATVSFK
eukprot:scaffold2551_cov113-Cylindrotheca_fusiformis.AAC.6